MTLSATVRPRRARQDAAVVLQGPDGFEAVLSAEEARELQRRILSAAIEVERGQRAAVARAKVREIRRSSKVDESLRGLDD